MDPTSLKRIRRAELPVRESERVMEMMGKLASVAKALQDTRQECSRMHVALEQAQEEARIAEFAREKAEALATARGNALMKCQDALASAEEQQIQLGGMLRSALEQLGVHSPEKRMTIEQQLCKTPAYYSQKLYNGNMPDSIHRRSFTPHCTPPLLGSLGVSPQHPTPPTGFTVYSNALSQDISPHLYKEKIEQVCTTPQGERYREPNSTSPCSTANTCEIGQNTAERLARMVLPHLDSEQIQCLVEYNGKGVVSPSPTPSPLMGVDEGVQESFRNEQQRIEQQHRDSQPSKTSTFSAVSVAHQNSSDLIKAHASFEGEECIAGDAENLRKRQAAMRIMHKLNQKLPPELRRTDYHGWLHAE